MDEKTIARFWAKVDRNGPIPVHRTGCGPCWLWTAATRGKGYGAFRLAGPKRIVEDAHRVAWQIANGAIPDATIVCHKCDRPRCCNPDHLFLGTYSDNMQDCSEKGRLFLRRGHEHTRGSKHARAILDEAAVRRIRCCTDTLLSLASEYGVSAATIGDVRRRRSWRHIA